MIKCNTATTSMSRTYRLSDFHFAPLTSDDATEYRKHCWWSSVFDKHTSGYI
jgi:hypothetical protein